MNCDEIRDLIALGAGGETTDHERIALESHVSVCAECARDLAEMRTLVGNLALLREGEMPAGTSGGIWEGLRFSVPVRRPRILQWTLRAAAMLVIGLSVGFTAKSIAARPVPAPSAFEENLPDPSRSTLISSNPSRAFTGTEPGAGMTITFGAPYFRSMLEAGTSHWLPQVDEVVESDDVRF